MSVALFVTFEREIPGVRGHGMNGKALANNLDALDEAATRLGLPPLLTFHSASPEDYSSLLGDEDGPFPPLGHDLPSIEEAVREQGGPDAAVEFEALVEATQEFEAQLDALRAEGMPIEEWFSPAEALPTIRNLGADVRENPGAFDRVDDLLLDLADLERYVSTAEEHGVRFHFSFDL